MSTGDKNEPQGPRKFNRWLAITGVLALLAIVYALRLIEFDQSSLTMEQLQYNLGVATVVASVIVLVILVGPRFWNSTKWASAARYASRFFLIVFLTLLLTIGFVVVFVWAPAIEYLTGVQSSTSGFIFDTLGAGSGLVLGYLIRVLFGSTWWKTRFPKH